MSRGKVLKDKRRGLCAKLETSEQLHARLERQEAQLRLALEHAKEKQEKQRALWMANAAFALARSCARGNHVQSAAVFIIKRTRGFFRNMR